MSLPAPPQQLIEWLPSGKAVCFDHKQRRCGKCTVDYSDGFADNEGEEKKRKKRNRNKKKKQTVNEDEVEEVDGSDDTDEEDRVFVLGTKINRFMPQWDTQILGPANTYKIKEDYNNIPKALPMSSLGVHECPTCELTWLVGEKGEAAASSHPSHHTYWHEYAGTSRSLFVFIDGACSWNGLPNAYAGIGVYLAKGSKHNLSEALPANVATSQKAELAAAARAMEIVRLKVLPERVSMVKSIIGGHAARDIIHMRLVIVTDSSYLVDGMCSHFENWVEDKQLGVLATKSGKRVENSEGFMKLRKEVERLSRVGVQVAYYLVAREENAGADALAKESLQR